MQKRDLATLAQKVLAMRHKMYDFHESQIPADRLDLKRSPGGMIDAEFVVQFIILAYAAIYPEFVENVGACALLHRFAYRRLLPYSLASEAAVALATLRKRQHELFLQGKPFLWPKSINYDWPFHAIRKLWYEVFRIQ